MSRRLPLIVILGATACGKSKLAIELAQRFRGQIISADSMQVYNGLDIVTNKVSEEEQKLAQHHMINLIDPTSRYSIVDFQRSALGLIEELLHADTLPIVVGGTNYYIESLVWKNFLLSSSENNPDGQHHTLIDAEAEELKQLPKNSLHQDEDLEDVEKFFTKAILHDGLKAHSSEKLWKILEKVDPKSAFQYHPNDRRKVVRCLQIFQRQQRNYSELLQDVNVSADGDKSSLGGPLRYEPTCVLWLSCDETNLGKILDERVEQMLKRGLLKELEDFHREYNAKRVSSSQEPDYTKGIFQTIGFKEFHNYLVLDDQAKSSDEGRKLLQSSIENMKLSTRRYAKVQLKWIKSRFLKQGSRDLPPVYELKTSFDVQGWTKQVSEPAFKIVESIIEQRPLRKELEILRHVITDATPENKAEKYFCKPCDRLFIGSNSIEPHLKCRKHKTMVYLDRLKRVKLMKEIEAEQQEEDSECHESK